MKEFVFKLVKGLARKDIPRDKRDIINDLIALGILENGQILKIKPKYRAGKVDITKKGFGFLIPIGVKERDYIIESHHLNGASKGDLVIAEIIKRKKGRPKAKVVYILEKSFVYSVVYLKYEFKNGRKVPVLRNVKTDQPVYVNEKKKTLKKLPDGAVFKVNNYTAKIEEVLGVLQDPWVDEKISLGLYNKKEEFSKKAIKEAKAFGDYVDKLMYPDRVDLTNLSFCTIDPPTAKDHDDAIYFDKEKNELYVAIADVSEYVYLNGNIDKEAKERGFSIYFPHKAIPMLPRELSENICSLKENEDRLAFVFKISFDDNNEVIKEELFEAIIHSHRKYSYDRVDEFLEGKFENIDEIDKEILSWLMPLWEKVKHIRTERLKTGLEFESDEIRMSLDENGMIKEVKIEKETPSHKLIEDCMLLANKAAAKMIDFGIFRVHEKPSQTSLDELYSELGALGIDVDVDEKDFVKVVEKIQAQAKELGIKKFVDKLIIRSQQQARYDAACTPHFALGFDRYTHFTSPIRRYSDLTLHRLLKATIKNQQKIVDYILRNVEALVVKLSELEREAMKVEWDFYDRKYARVAELNIGKKYEGIIEDKEIPPIAKILEDKLLGARVFLKNTEKFNLFEKVDVEIVSSNIATAKIKGKAYKKLV
ncbi:VacB/RNase II family 3'-5' exoribonuclease [Caminibacter mediatlanticus TB-2]|uniref:exoribonuclease II n=1 Tax=Caminibacter mediatlanticus TB-2 TaxID=391592 RepID=A0ABX5V7S1_9BACT|nr:ribonuclease R family protein [Caminibacter mediatlanticus]QCT94283.1 VacB/RNase II family 3'-5' exoribonuclease [Caminibacter mediatlanticus TB-2]